MGHFLSLSSPVYKVVMTLHLGNVFVLVIFLAAVIKHLARSHVREKRFVLAHSSKGSRASWWENHSDKSNRQLVP